MLVYMYILLFSIQRTPGYAGHNLGSTVYMYMHMHMYTHVYMNMHTYVYAVDIMLTVVTMGTGCVQWREPTEDPAC